MTTDVGAGERRREFEGYWWLPEAPDVQWAGTLSWRPGKSPKLKLRYRSVGESDPPDQSEALFGLDASGTPLTILRVGSGGSTQSGFLSEKRYTAGHILRGIHVSSLNGFRANRVDVSLQYLDGWINEDPFGPWQTADETWGVSYKRPKERCFELFPGTTLKLFHSTSTQSNYRERTIRYESFFGVEKQRPFDFVQAFKRVNALRLLLHFACLQPVRLTTLYFEDFAHAFVLGEASHPKQLELYSASIDPPLKVDPQSFDYVFTFHDVEERFGTFCKEWFRFCAEYREALGCYTTTVYSRPSDQIALLSMTQAFETYHQRRFRPRAGSEDAKFLNRIKRLCDLHSNSLMPVVGNLEMFAQSVRDSRHYYTHHDPDLLRKGRVLRGTDLTILTFRLQFFFRLCVLADFGLERDPHNVLKRQLPSRIVEYF